MQKPHLIRNLCILAHVDHGKTTIADSLVAINGHVPKRLAGEVRFLDDRQDEMERGITMKSNAISLSYKTRENQNLIVNLIDTPGHIDFSSEVSAAIRICDGALIVVDVVEGMCVQTKEVIKQAFEERVKMILIINKIDRMILELEKNEREIFENILRLIEDCNAYIAELCQYDALYTAREEDYLFAPNTGNVIFTSGVDGWGVTTKQISQLFIDKFEDESVLTLNHKLWDFDYYVKGGKLVTGAIEKHKPNAFITCVLSTIYYVYFHLRVRQDKDKVPLILDRLKLAVNPTLLHPNSKTQVRNILSTWKSLADTILNQVQMVIPSPPEIPLERCEYLINKKKYFGNEVLCQHADHMITNIGRTDPLDMTIGYVSKMFAVHKSNLPTEEVILIDDDISDAFSAIGLVRIYSGMMRAGDYIYILHKNYKPPPLDVDIEEYIQKCKDIERVQIKEIYVLLGKELSKANTISQGNICGMKGLQNHVARTATLCSSPFGLPMIERLPLEPIVRNSIECEDPCHLDVLRRSLKFLKQIDSCVQVVMQETGELILLTAGDVHLAKCLEDVKATLPPEVQLVVSKPIVTVKETVVTSTKRIDLSSRSHTLSIEEIGLTIEMVIISLPTSIVDIVKANFEILKIIEDFHPSSIDSTKFFEMEAHQEYSPKNYNEAVLATVNTILRDTFSECTGPWGALWQNIWSIGKSRTNINMLFNNTNDYNRDMFSTLDEMDFRSVFDHCIVNGFDMCCRAGPICEEPLTHCAFVVNKFSLKEYTDLRNVDLSLLTVSTIPSAVKECCRAAFQKQTQRLVEPIFAISIQANTKILGKIYTVISRRHGRVIDAIGMDEDEKSFLVKAQLPVSESYDFANEIRSLTSGQANANMRFSHYELLDANPYFILEEAEVDDEEDVSNVGALRASGLRNEIRKRKGLKVHDQVVVHAERQRTLNKKK